MDKERTRVIQRAAMLAMAGNAVLALTKLMVGISTQTLSVLGDGIDSSVDILTSSIPLFASRIIDRKPNKSFPFGYGRIEATATTLLAFAIFYAGLELGLRSIHTIINPKPFQTVSFLAIAVTLFSIAGKMVLAYLQMSTGKKVGSSMLQANGKNMLADIVISISVLAGLLLTQWTGNLYVDGLISLFIAFLIVRTAVNLFVESNKELMDGMDNTDVYQEISRLAAAIEGVEKPHRMRVRKVGIRLMVYLDIELPGDMSVSQAHRLSQAVENNIRDNVEGIYDVVVHIEPTGNIEDETYGVCMDVEE